MRGYYLTSEKWALQALKMRRLKLSRFEEMNDPFELLGVELKTKVDRKIFYQIKKELHEEAGVLCFSRTWHNPVMWSHYGDKHNGICLGFDLLKKWTYPVTYEVSRLKDEVAEGISDNDSFSHKLLTTKFEQWRYEEEIRKLIELKNATYENGMYFLPFCNALQLREVIVGARCRLEPKEIAQLIPDENLEVKIRKARPAFNSFKIVQNRSVKVISVACA